MDNFIINQEESLKGLISKEHYFQSLLQIAHSNNLLSIRELEIIQLQIFELLTEIIGYYTRDESSSVREEVAEQIILSLCYTLGMCLKEHKTIKGNLELIKNTKLKQLFTEGEKVLKTKFELCKSLLNTVYETRLNVETFAYTDTIEYGIPLFFKDYDIRFASHETPGSIDYQLSIDVCNLVGVEYIEEYLNKIILENKFCSLFDAEEIEALLKGFNNEYAHMLVNIFQLVLTNCIGCILMGKGGTYLDITEGDRVYINSMIKDLPEEMFEKLILMAAEKLCNNLCIGDEVLIDYINKSVLEIIPQIENAIKIDKLESVFITLKKSEENLLKYEDGESLSNSSFRQITEEIRACHKVEEKIAIIIDEIHSLKDLVDVLGADCIFEEEFIEVFKALEDFEIALLIKATATSKAFDNEYGTESEKEWQRKLKEYLDSLNALRKEELLRMAEGIEV
ncbi:hypothetical protein CFOLD11_09770 [Clostridium folliculivorans]|uniref:Uncharacterized protein n=1 Tax=Clostridium folliculivorans TaxID=2886038 RepID=A0A9W6D9Q4_9CLOT|nr:DUF6179 domain-containing protein [Clostridium folliculivorans]GKU24151.1 hypothetical protein CFOLD11_09770 [Clostridium folliculivorans]